MRSIDEIEERWRQTASYAGGGLAELQRGVKDQGEMSPCVTGCRSFCWKAFLLFRDAAPSTWPSILTAARTDYAARRDHHLRFIKHPELLTELTVDPLADDPDSPWNTVRADEITRAEIAQDVQRLPDEPFYHEDRIQTMIVDILFLYCKLHPKAGGYRQGMHELLAPVLYVVDLDSVNRANLDSSSSSKSTLSSSEQQDFAVAAEMLDSAFVEADAFALFAKIMERARSFYEVRDPITKSALAAVGRDESSAIVERSKHIHEVCLAKVDPELARHLKNIEILPQIFLIRWIRLLFGREFPFDQLLIVWDTMFAVDPSLDLIDLICVAMLIRIRWSLLEADYSVCLQLLLKYPAPSALHGPHTFVDDAVYLRSHLNASGGASLIMKYTGKLPSRASSAPNSRPTTPSIPNLNNLRQRALGNRSPLPSPSRFLQQQGGVEAMFQGAARRVLERGENLGINQAVRDAVGEIRRNVQGFQDARLSPRAAKDMLASDPQTRTAMAALEKRNHQLAGMLEETVASLRSLVASDLDDKVKTLELIEIAAAKVQFVKVYLEDSNMEIQETSSGMASPTEGQDNRDVVMTSGTEEKVVTPTAPAGAEAAATAISNLSIAEVPKSEGDVSVGSPVSSSLTPVTNSDVMDTSMDAVAAVASSSNTEVPKPTVVVRPSAPIPTRSTLAQSSFSWMLEPDQSVSGAVSSPVAPPSHGSTFSSSPHSAHRKRPSGNASRERNAFLFGEVTAENGDGGRRSIGTDDIFGLEPIRKSKQPK